MDVALRWCHGQEPPSRTNASTARRKTRFQGPGGGPDVAVASAVSLPKALIKARYLGVHQDSLVTGPFLYRSSCKIQHNMPSFSTFLHVLNQISRIMIVACTTGQVANWVSDARTAAAICNLTGRVGGAS